MYISADAICMAAKSRNSGLERKREISWWNGVSCLPTCKHSSITSLFSILTSRPSSLDLFLPDERTKFRTFVTRPFCFEACAELGAVPCHCLILWSRVSDKRSITRKYPAGPFLNPAACAIPRSLMIWGCSSVVRNSASPAKSL